MIITSLKDPFSCLRLCWLIRIGKIRATPAVRQVAKAATFSFAYGAPGRW